jgi:multiple sugar transport system permease protein
VSDGDGDRSARSRQVVGEVKAHGLLTEGGPRGATTTLIIDTYKVAISSQRFGEGAARAVVIVVLLAVFSLFYLYFLNRVNRHYGAK